MSRYLTPSKIGYVALILLYLDDFVTADSSVPVLSFITSSFLPPRPPLSTMSYDPTGDFAATIETFYKTLWVHSSSVPGRNLWDLFLDKLWSIHSFDTLHGFFCSVTSRIWSSRDQRLKDRNPIFLNGDARVILSRRSPIGILLRRTQLEFNRLQLRDVVKLWRAFTKFKEPTITLWRKRNPSVRTIDFDINSTAIDLNTDVCLTNFPWKGQSCSTIRETETSMSDIECLLEVQIDRMQSEFSRAEVYYIPGSVGETCTNISRIWDAIALQYKVRI